MASAVVLDSYYWSTLATRATTKQRSKQDPTLTCITDFGSSMIEEPKAKSVARNLSNTSARELLV